jgi:pimeloyl-ACP methyl ester carboxylesterase
MKGQHVGSELSAIRAPTTCLAGTRDASTLRASLEAIAAALRAARLVDLDGPHLLHLETPAAFSAALADHLAWAARVEMAGPL